MYNWLYYLKGKIAVELSEINKIFIEQEVNKLTDGSVQRFLLDVLPRFPDYFWTAPASKQKYHPPDERKEGGLVLHTRRVIRLTEDMVRFYNLNAWERDILLASAILHDSFARGVPPDDINASDIMHPLYPRQQFPFKAFADRFIDGKVYEEIMECVESHQGPWSPSPLLQSRRKLPSIFQLIDHIASRSHVTIEI